MAYSNTQRAKGSPIYLVPSMITLSSMFCGFYAMVQSIGGDFYHAGLYWRAAARHADNCFSDFSSLGRFKRLAANG